MNKRKTTKEILTEAILEELPSEYHTELIGPVDRLLFDWWFTGRQDGLRLTDAGDLAFRLAQIEFYQVELGSLKQSGSWYSFLLDLSKKIKCPYYLGFNKVEAKNKPYIRLYDSKIAMMINLYGSLEEYLSSAKFRN